MNWHSKPTASIVVWMDLRSGKGLHPGLPAPRRMNVLSTVCSKPSKRTICGNAILTQVWLRPGVPRPFDLCSSKRVLNKLHFALLYAGYGLWHRSAATRSGLPGAREQRGREAWLSARLKALSAGEFSSTEAGHESPGATLGVSGPAPQVITPLACLHPSQLLSSSKNYFLCLQGDEGSLN